MPAVRAPAVAGLFYPAAAADCRREIERCYAGAASRIPEGRRVLGAVAPHAGWTFSGPAMAAALLPLEAADPDTVLLFGADHHGLHPGRASVHPGGTWATPAGEAEVDGKLAEALAADPASRTDLSAEAHAPEHSLEVIVPFLRVRIPAARILPVVTPPGAGAAAVGAAAVRAARRLGRRPVVVGSSDLTHYGERYGFTPRGIGREALRWAKEENDREILERVLALDPEGIEASARRRRNACGPGAMAAAASAARELGAREGLLLRHTTSAEVMGDEDPDMFVGYAAVAFLA